MTRAIHVGGSPRLATPSLHINGTSVSSDGAPNGIGLPCGSTKMFLRPGSLAAGTRGEWSLATVAMWPCSTPPQSALDRKSTRLNSSHDQISYAVFCLKKKKHSSRALGHVQAIALASIPS